MKINILNIAPIEWFSPHFVYSDDIIQAFDYDPLKKKIDIDCFLIENNIHALNVFRFDLVGDELNRIHSVPMIEWSTEIFPRTLSKDNFQHNTINKFFHCLSKTNFAKKIIHYDVSRSQFLNFAKIPHLNHFLPVNISYIENTSKRDIDVLFFGRASVKRCEYLSRLKELGIKFIWIENGLSFEELSAYLNRTKVIVNLSAEKLDNFEPRINIGLAYGALVVTEVSYGLLDFMNKNQKIASRIYTFNNHIDDFIGTIFLALSNYHYEDLSQFFCSNKVFLNCLKNVYE